MRVTTIIVTYNHERYIAGAIESALSQSGDFEHEILISDDGSTDATPRIVQEYARRYPLLIRNISSIKNLGISGNYRKCIAEAKGDFIAVLEGDDRWSVSDKLKKQHDFLVENPDCHMVFSKIAIDDGIHPLKHLGRYNGLPSKLTGADFFAASHICLIGNFSCCMFRADSLKKLPESLYEHRISEIAVSFYLESLGPIGFISEEQTVYNEYGGGVWTGADRLSKLRQQRFCREAAMKVCARQWLPKFIPLMSAIDVQLDGLHDKCNAENGELRKALAMSTEVVDALRKSLAYRVGLALTYPLRTGWRALKAICEAWPERKRDRVVRVVIALMTASFMSYLAWRCAVLAWGCPGISFEWSKRSASAADFTFLYEHDRAASFTEDKKVRWRAEAGSLNGMAEVRLPASKVVKFRINFPAGCDAVLSSLRLKGSNAVFGLWQCEVVRVRDKNSLRVSGNEVHRVATDVANYIDVVLPGVVVESRTIPFCCALLVFAVVFCVALYRLRNLPDASPVRLHEISLACIFLGLCACVFVFMTHANISVRERRKLAESPLGLRVRSFWDCSFQASVDAYVNDRFGGRSMLQDLWAFVMRQSRVVKSEKAIFVRENGWMFPPRGNDSPINDASVLKAFNAVVELDGICRKEGVHLQVVLIPSKSSLYGPKCCPQWLYDEESQHRFLLQMDDFVRGLQDAGVDALYLYDSLAKAAETDLVYFKADHHQTDWGAFVSADAIVRRLNENGIMAERPLMDEYRISENVLIRSERDRSFGYGAEAALMNLPDGFVKKKLLVVPYRYYDHVRSVDMKEVDAGNIANPGVKYVSPKSNLPKVCLLSNSLGENLNQILPWCFSEELFFRFNKGKVVNRDLEYSVVTRYWDEIVKFRPNVLIVYVYDSQIARLRNLMTEKKGGGK